LSTEHDWMNARPHGASVVPNVAVQIRMASLLVGKVETTRPCSSAGAGSCCALGA